MNEDLLTAIVGVVAAVLGAFAQQLVTAAGTTRRTVRP